MINDIADLTDADSALFKTVVDVLEGPLLDDKKPSHELLHYTTGMTQPLSRITTHPARPLNVVGAVARFVWMVAASDRVEDIKYYEPKVADYTDNEITVPGSSYGRRLFESQSGLNQIAGVVDRLRKEPESRRAAAVVWAPNDAVRESKDIPCTFGMFFHIRGDGLIASTVMRSNNAFLLLPFNIFEFSVLAEVVAAASGVPLTGYVHWAASMHVYTESFQMDGARKIADSEPSTSLVMPPIPSDGDPLDQIRLLARDESRLRHASTEDEFDQVLNDCELNEYWKAYLNVLAAWGAAKRGWSTKAEVLTATLPDHFRTGTQFALKKLMPQEAPPTPAPETVEDELDLGLDLPGAPHDLSPDDAEVVGQFELALLEYSKATGTEIPNTLVPVMRRAMFDQGDFALAARDLNQLTTQHLSLTYDSITNALEAAKLDR